MPVPSAITDLSTSAGSNSPAGSDNASTIDDYLRAHAAFIAQLRDGSKNLEVGTVSAPACAFTGNSNTGFYSTGADQVSIATGGVRAANFTPTVLSVAGLIYANNGSGTGLGGVTVSTSAASGGNNGDIWLQY